MSLYSDQAPFSQQFVRPRSFEGNGFQRAVLGLSGYDRFGNRTGWGRFKETALPLVYGATGAIGAAALGINPATGAKLGSALGGGLNKLSNLSGQGLLEGTDGEQTANDAAVASASKSDFVGGLVNTVATGIGGAMDVKSGQLTVDDLLSKKINETNPTEYNKAVEALRLKKQQYSQGLAESGIQTLQSMAAWQSSPRSLNTPMGTTRFMQFRGGGVVDPRAKLISKTPLIPNVSLPSTTLVKKPENPLQIQNNGLVADQQKFAERQTQIGAPSNTSPAVQQYWQNQQEAKDRKETTLKVADTMAMGSMIPNPVTQAIGAIGTLGGGLIRGNDVVKDVKRGNYSDAALGAVGLGLDIAGLNSTPYRNAIGQITSKGVAGVVGGITGTVISGKRYFGQVGENLKNYGRIPGYSTQAYQMSDQYPQGYWREVMRPGDIFPTSEWVNPKPDLSFFDLTRDPAVLKVSEVPEFSLKKVFSGNPLDPSVTQEEALKNSLAAVEQAKKGTRLMWKKPNLGNSRLPLKTEKTVVSYSGPPANLDETYRGVKTNLLDPRTVIASIQEGVNPLKGEKHIATQAITNAPKNPRGGTYVGTGIYSASGLDVAQGYAGSKGYVGTLKNPVRFDRKNPQDFFSKGVNADSKITLSEDEAKKLNSLYQSKGGERTFESGESVDVVHPQDNKLDFSIAEILKDRGKQFKIKDYGGGNFHTIFLPGVKPDLIKLEKSAPVSGQRSFTVSNQTSNVSSRFRFPYDFDNAEEVRNSLKVSYEKRRAQYEDKLSKLPESIRDMYRMTDVVNNPHKYGTLSYSKERYLDPRLEHIRKYAPLYLGGATVGALGALTATKWNDASEKIDTLPKAKQKFRTGGVPTTVLETAQLSPSSLVGFEAADLAPTLEAMPIAEEAPAKSLPVLSRIANAERSGYNAVNHVGPGHYGKYQFEPMLIRKYAGVSEQEFLKSPKLQEEAMWRRLSDLQSEAAKVKATTGSGLPLEDIMVGVHFKGMGQMKRELLNPGLMYQATDKNPSTANYIFNRSYGRFFGGGSVMRSFKVGGTALDIKANVGYTHYGPKDTTEDYFLVDKKEANNSGLGKVIGKLAFGEARYGERIFDQDSNLLMSSVFQSALPKEQKIKLLGEHVLEEIGTHGDHQKFQQGGEPKPKKFTDASGRVYDLTPNPKFPNRYINIGDSQFYYRYNEQTRSFEKVPKPGYAQAISKPEQTTAAKPEAPKQKKPLLDDLMAGFARPFKSVFGIQASSDKDTVGTNPTPSRPLIQPGPSFTNEKYQTLDKQAQTQTNTKSGVPGLNLSSPTTPAAPASDSIAWYFPNVAGDMDTMDAQARITKATNALGLTLPKNYGIDGKWGDLTNQAYNNALRGYKNRYLAQGKTPAEAERMALVDLGVAPKIGKDASGKVGVVALNDPSRINTITVDKLNGSRYDPKTGQQTLVPMGINEAKPVVPPPTPTTPSANNFNALQGLTSFLPDVARIGAGILMNKANQPKGFDLGQEYFKMKADLENRANQGLTSQQRSAYQTQLNQGYAQGVGTLRNLVGGGANQSAVIAGLGRLSAGYNQGVGTMNALDTQAQANNRLRYQGAVMNDITLRGNLFAREEQQKAMNRQAAGQLIGASVQNMTDRNDFNGFYGPDSLYSQLQNSMIAKTNAETQAAKDVAAAYGRRLGVMVKP